MCALKAVNLTGQDVFFCLVLCEILSSDLPVLGALKAFLNIAIMGEQCLKKMLL